MAGRVRVPEGLREAQKAAEAAGWIITVSGGGHLRWKSPGGGVVFTPFSPRGGKRSVQNSLRDLRHGGLQI